MAAAIKPFYFDISDDEIEFFLDEARQILKSGTLILGNHTQEFERGFAEFVGTKHAISVNSGTSGLEILLRLKG
ncbi:DegT/DnrJ/EryC1/StrS family aminotransferase [Synechocystis sp. B12]|nr:DegT/DnrJ/EryC1/StrS family aminotransferase [Synechocystis sp. B12]